jgi:hypothetical protein
MRNSSGASVSISGQAGMAPMESGVFEAVIQEQWPPDRAGRPTVCHEPSASFAARRRLIRYPSKWFHQSQIALQQSASRRGARAACAARNCASRQARTAPR